MIRVGLAHTAPDYRGLTPPFGPGTAYPELRSLLGDEAGRGPANPVYAAVRGSLRALGLDDARFGREDWNPLGELAARGSRVVLKPNFIRHWNPAEGGEVDCVITHGSVIRAVADYAWIAVGSEGSVTVAEAPQQDCDFQRIREVAGLDALSRFYEEHVHVDLPVIDLRREAVVFRDGIIVERRGLPGDPQGYRVVDLGTRSFFHDAGLDPERMRGADYDPTITADHHRGGRNEYLLSETALRADLVVNLPKLKTHKKTGVTLAFKNLVGINGDKNWLPHHCAGPVGSGGDEFPGGGLLDRARSRLADRARSWLARGRGTRALRLARRLEWAARGDAFIRSGNWHGNRTTWRMCLDLNRAFYYSDAKGLHLEAPRPVRKVLTVLDGVIGGEGEGPLAPTPVPSGVILAATDPAALDLTALRVMGFDPDRVPKIREAIGDEGPRITAVRHPEEVRVAEWRDDAAAPVMRRLHEIRADLPYRPHAGWVGHIERQEP